MEVDGETLPASQFAIVRTGSYVGYGFGGFVYERNGGVELPDLGAGRLRGRVRGHPGVRRASGREYTRGDVDIAIDFRDFNAGSGVQGTISDREAFDIDGNRIPTGGRRRAAAAGPLLRRGPRHGDRRRRADQRPAAATGRPDTGDLTEYESGTYYAIVGGDNADEIVGVFVVESDDPRFEGVTAQETGGFIVYR